MRFKVFFQKRNLSLSVKMSAIFTVIFFLGVTFVSLIIISLLKNNILERKINAFLLDSTVIHKIVDNLTQEITFEKIVQAEKNQNFDEKLQKEHLNLFSDSLGRSLRNAQIPYFLSYAIYLKNKDDQEKKIILATNDPFIPLLPLTENPPYQFYFEKSYYTDGDLDIIYQAIQNDIIFVQTSMSIDLDSLDLLIKRLPYIILLVSLPILLFSFFSALFITKRLLRPVAQITKTAKKISSQNLGQRLPETHTKDELQELSVTFNDLFSRLQNDFERERHFTGDVSHELKTPLAVLLGHTDLLRRWGKNDPAVLDKSLNIIFDEAKSIQNLIDTLLLLTRSENTLRLENKKQYTTFNMFSLLQEIKERTIVVHPEVNFEIVCNNTDEIFSHQENLIQALRIFIANAIAYSDSPARIILAWNKKKRQLVIQDHGHGISKKDLPNIFKRFYRADESRNRQTGHTGLGLPIAKAILDNLDCSITIESSQEKTTHGTKITVTFEN